MPSSTHTLGTILPKPSFHAVETSSALSSLAVSSLLFVAAHQRQTFRQPTDVRPWNVTIRNTVSTAILTNDPLDPREPRFMVLLCKASQLKCDLKH